MRPMRTLSCADAPLTAMVNAAAATRPRIMNDITHPPQEVVSAVILGLAERPGRIPEALLCFWKSGPGFTPARINQRCRYPFGRGFDRVKQALVNGVAPTLLSKIGCPGCAKATL